MQHTPAQPATVPAPDPLLASDLFRSFPPEAHATLLAAFETLHLPADAVLFAQGAPGDSMYLVQSGRVGVLMEVDSREQLVVEHGPGQSVGELALLSGKPRTARVVTLEPSLLLRLTSQRFAALAADYPQAVAAFSALLIPRMRRSQLVGVLGSLFGPLNPTTLQDIINELEWRHLLGGATLFRQGDPGDSFAIVVNGRLRVDVTSTDGQQRTVSELGRGQYVGELAVLTGEVRSATVVAIRDSDVVLLAKSAFDRLLAQYPQVMMQITRVVIERLRNATNPNLAAPAQRSTSIALLAISPEIQLGPFAEQLASALAGHGSTIHLSSQRLDATLGLQGQASLSENHPALVTLNSWLSERESEHRTVLYEADSEATPWTLRCLRRADLVLLVGAASGNPHPGPLEQSLGRLGLQARRELVLLHPAGSQQASNTSRWLSKRSVSAHYHVRQHHNADMQRLARLCTGRGIGLVLSGGGARGLAHIGVIRALEEAGIVPDAVGGSSAGALIAANYAMGRSWQEIDGLARDLLHQWRQPDYALPTVALLRGHKLTSTLRQVFGEWQIEDLWHSFFCLSVNLTRLKVHVHQQGPLWRAIRASVSLPLVFPPMLEDGNILVDGGLIDNLPAEAMRMRCPEGLVFAVDASQELALNRHYRFGTGVSGWHVFLNRFVPRERRIVVPSLVDTLLRVLEYSAVTSRHSNAPFADLVIRPPVDHFGTLEFSAYDRILEAGYYEARERINAWRAENRGEKVEHS
jgi:lysophospholipid hydrolase